MTDTAWIAIAAALVALLVYGAARARQAAAEAEATAAKGKAIAATANGMEELKQLKKIGETAIAECKRLEEENAALVAENERLRERVTEPAPQPAHDLEYQLAVNRGQEAAIRLNDAKRRLEEARQTTYLCDLEIARNMTGRQFEIFVGRLLEGAGYADVQVTQQSSDRGGDVLATDKSGKRVCFQLKRTASPPGVAAVQQALCGAKYYDANLGAVITTAPGYTQEAMEVAHKTGVFLLAADDLHRLMEEHIEETLRALREAPALSRSLAEKILQG